MRIALCDDEKVILDYLIQKIEAYFHLKEPYEITSYQSAEEMLFKCGDSIPFDLVILDIQMGGMNGMELAKKIRQIDSNLTIVFLTGVMDYVFEGYEVGAFRYLLKPLKEAHLHQILDEVRDKIIRERESIILTINREQVKVYLDDINYIESLGHYVMIHTNREVYELKKSLSDMMKQLNDCFVLSHRSYIVNLEKIERISKEVCLLANHIQVPISRSNYQSLNERFIAYYRR
jgi:DNA-binding LytR/AlgR family response regulator